MEISDVVIVMMLETLLATILADWLLKDLSWTEVDSLDHFRLRLSQWSLASSVISDALVEDYDVVS